MARTWLVGFLAGTALLVAGPSVAGPSVDASTASVLTAPTSVDASTAGDRQLYYWRWSDGSQARHRTFRQSQYRVPERLPRLIVTAYPSTPVRAVRLQYRRDGRWHTEDAGRTDGAGQVRLALVPYCPDGAWCDGTFEYRAVAGGRTASLSITYVR